jgi:hypothetical protein
MRQFILMLSCLYLGACGGQGTGENKSSSNASKISSSILASQNAISRPASSSATSVVTTSSKPQFSSSKPQSSATNSVSKTSAQTSVNSSKNNSSSVASSISTNSRLAAVAHGGNYFGVTEQFNRYYTDPTWTPLRKVYVSATGNGNGQSLTTPSSVEDALSAARPGDLIKFAAGEYNGCFGVDDTHSGTYDQPIALVGERDGQGNPSTKINCCNTGRRACVNIEFANYIAIDSFEFMGGKYGVRIVGGYDTPSHVKGNAILNSYAHDAAGDPFFTGGNDWFAIENNRAERGGAEDGHGIYLSNGSDFNIVRYNETNDNKSSDFQINADPISTCEDEGIAYDDVRCDGDAKQAKGDGVSEYMLVDGNYFHNGRAQGANFTSVRNSVVRNNIFAFYVRHGVSFWQETSNPKLGSSNNIVHHNLFVGTNDKALLQFYANSNHNDVRNNVLMGVSLPSSVNASTILLAASDTTLNNVYGGNMYVGGKLVRMNDDTDVTGNLLPGTDEHVRSDFSSAWSLNFPDNRLGSAESFRPSSTAPWLNLGELLNNSLQDIDGVDRTQPTDLGPWVAP